VHLLHQKSLTVVLGLNLIMTWF